MTSPGSWVDDGVAVLERLDTLEKRLDTLTGLVPAEVVRRVAAAVRAELVKEAKAVAAKFSTNSDLRIGAQAVARAIESADLSGVVPALSGLVRVEADGPGDLVKQLADARAEIARLTGGAS
jgi:hypothetical protein